MSQSQSNPLVVNANGVQWLAKFVPNNLEAYLENNGILFNNPTTGQGGLIFPSGSGKTLAWSAGLWIIGRSSLDNQLHSACSDLSDYGSEYQAGPITGTYNGDTNTIASITTPVTDPSRNLMILSKTAMPTDSTYQLWASGAVPGAPLTHDGKPEILGDWAAYWVTNDLNLSGRPAVSNTAPMGLEVQNYFFGSNDGGPLSNIIFMRMRIINKSSITYDSTYLGFFSDTDVGDANDDYAACDTVRGLGYVYNGKSFDAVYGAACPASGYDFLEGPRVPGAPADSGYFEGVWKKGCKNLSMTAFTTTLNPLDNYKSGAPPLGTPVFIRYSYNFLQGRVGTTGSPFIGPDSRQSHFMDSGDPVTGTGWLGSWEQGAPADVRILLGSGPFTLQPADTQEVLIACIVGEGTDYINSIVVLRNYDSLAHRAFKGGVLTGVKGNKVINEPNDYTLEQNYPNPFNPTTNISFSIRQKSFVTLNVYDVIGREVSTLVSDELQAGNYTVRWNAGSSSSGVYFYRLQAGGYTETKKLVLLR